MTVAEQMRQDLLNMVQNHDYSHMFSDSHSAWEAGMQSENQIKAKIHALCAIHKEDAYQLYRDCEAIRPEQYTDGLTHNTIKNWFSTYINE